MTLHPIQRRWLAEQLVRLRRADEQRRYAASQRRGRIDPNPHQIHAVIFALSRVREGGCILADEVGLGKTIEAGLVIVQLMAEGARRVLIIVPKPLQGQWHQELYSLFGVEARTDDFAEEGALGGDGVFLVGREWAGGERGSEALRAAEPFDLCVIDEAHEIFAGLYKRYDRYGVYQPTSPHAQMAGRVKELLLDTPVLLLTATPIQNSLAELWGLVQYVEPTGTLLGDVRTFRQVFCDGDDRKLVAGQDVELRQRLATVCKRTLRRQAQEFLERPFVDRRTQLFEYSMTAEERALYEDLTRFLMDPKLAAFRGNHRRLLIISFHRQMASSVKALAASLGRVASRLRGMLGEGDGQSLDDQARSMVDDLEDDFEETEVDDGAPPPIEQVRGELERVEGFIARAQSLPKDSKAEALVTAVELVLKRAAEGEGSGKIVIFTESLTTQEYLRDLLLDSGLEGDDVTLFRGRNEGPRVAAALERWQSEVGAGLGPYNQPSRSVAVRLALVHEFRTHSRVFISTEAGAKGLNLQFCETLVNYDLPWNPQRIEQRIGRCHRYSQDHDVTVINFLAADNEAQRLTFEILSQKLDLFGTVLDASDEVIHRPKTQAPETLAGAMAVDFETRLRRIYDRARTLDQITSDLRDLRENIGSERERYERELERTASLIESRFDEEVRQRFHRIQQDLPATLAALDHDAERVLTAYLGAVGARFERREEAGRVRFAIAQGSGLPDGLDGGLTVISGPAEGDDRADFLHLGHPLLEAAVAEARRASDRPFQVRLELAEGAPAELRERRGQRGRLVVLKVRYSGFEPVDRLLPVAVMETTAEVLPAATAEALLALTPTDLDVPDLDLDLDDEDVDDALDEALFVDQGEVAGDEQERFDRTIAQIERYLDDRVMVLERQRRRVEKNLTTALEKRDSVLGADARTDAEKRVRELQETADDLDAEIRRLLSRDDPDYEKWRQRAHRRRYVEPTAERMLDVSFVLA